MGLVRGSQWVVWGGLPFCFMLASPTMAETSKWRWLASMDRMYERRWLAQTLRPPAQI